MESVLLDAGALIALFSPDDRHHVRFDRLVQDFSRRRTAMLTTWPCVDEASHLLGPPQRFEMLSWIHSGGAQIYPLMSRHLGEMVGWMRTYTEPGKIAMDLADASLYWLANTTGICDIMTVDERDFRRYRLPDGSTFNIL